MSHPKTKENSKVISLRLSDPKKWSWRKLEAKFGRDHTTLQKMFYREIKKANTNIPS